MAAAVDEARKAQPEPVGVSHLARFSIEVTPREAEGIADFREHLAAGTRVYVGSLPGGRPRKLLETCLRLSDAGMIPVPHLAVRQWAELGALQTFVTSLVTQARVAEALVIAGDCSRPAGALTQAMDMIATGLLEDAGIREIAVAGHPGNHPHVRAERLDAALLCKQQYARHSRAGFRIVTQFVFDAAPVRDWCRRTQRLGIELPIHVGLPGVMSLRALARFARICGVPGVTRAVLAHLPALVKLGTSTTPATTLRAVSQFACAEEPRIAGFHFFSFGSFLATTQWLSEQASRPDLGSADPTS